MDWRKEQPLRKAPVLAGVALVCCGALLMKVRPHLLELPEEIEPGLSPKDRLDRGDRVGAVVQSGRDGLLSFLPANLLEWVGRGLLTLGGLVVFTRLLDMLIDDEDITS